MFTSNSKPFKLCYFRKSILSSESKALLLTSFPCVHFQNVKFIGSLFEDGLFLLGKNKEGNYCFGNEEYEVNKEVNDDGDSETNSEIRKEPMSLRKFIEDFKNSDGLDFMIISTPCHFLLTRQKDRKIKIFMTTSPNFIEIFSDVEGIFGSWKEEITETDRYYSKEGETVIDTENTENTPILRFGPLKDGVIKFEQYYLNKMTIKELQETIDSIYDKECDYVEILARCKIGGVRKGDDFTWFVEVAEDCSEAEYISELTKIFKPFVIKEE